MIISLLISWSRSVHREARRLLTMTMFIFMQLITQESSEIHHIHPLKAHFSFQDDNLIPCLLHLTNKTDKHIAFMLSSTTEEQPFEATPLNHDIVMSRSIYTLDIKMPTDKQKSNLILQSSIYGDKYIYRFTDQSECDQFFKDAKETRNVVHEVVLEPVLSQQGETTSEVRWNRNYYWFFNLQWFYTLTM